MRIGGAKKLALKQEVARRVKQQEIKEQTPELLLADACFEQQYKFIMDPAKFKTAVCSRRAGKSSACALDLIDTAMRQEGDVVYITLNRKSAKKIIWRELLRLDKKFKLNCKIDNTELTMMLANGNIIHVSGAKDSSEIEKFRGMALRKVYIDEVQSFRPYIEELIDDVLEPALTDYDGSLILIGTPGPVPAGYFYTASHSAGWSHHKWTLHDNPYILQKSGKTAQEIIKERAERRGLPMDAPSIRREYFGEWVRDEDSLVFKFDRDRNLYFHEPEDLMYVMGVDIGYQDADAIAILGYSLKEQKVYLVEESIKTKQNITELANQMKYFQEKYKIVKTVMDAGALGKKIQEEIRTRHGISVYPAEKTRKNEFIELMNDDLRTGKFMAKPSSRFEQDAALLQWDFEMNPPQISSRYHSDVCDAALYAWRECRHYIKPDEAPRRLSAAEAMAAMEEAEMERWEQQRSGQSGFTDVNSWEDLGITDDPFNGDW